MTTREKMLAGEYYIAFEDSLTQERERAKDLLFEFNNTRPSLRKEREAILRELIPDMGKNCWIESPFNCDYGSNLSLGDNFYANTNCCILDCAQVTIGDNVLFGPNVSLYTPEHAFDAGERAAGYERSLPIEIGDNVWVCGSVTIVGGVKIGSNSVIAAGSIVVKDVPENVLVAGNPARVIRKITEKDKMMYRA